MNLILIGMPASGKSTLGKAVAKKMKYKFVDGDKLIEKKYNKKLKDIIAEVGNDGFLKIENEVNADIKGDNMVISPGGSVIFCEDAMKNFANIGKIMYLEASCELIESRIKDPVKRGIVLEKDETLRDVFNKRKPFFEKYSDIIYSVDEESIGKAVCDICKIIKES